MGLAFVQTFGIGKAGHGVAQLFKDMLDRGRVIVLGADEIGDCSTDVVCDKAAMAHVVKDVMDNTLGKVYDDLNDLTKTLESCVSQSADTLRHELDDTHRELSLEMRLNDFNTHLHSAYLRSSNRLGVVLDFMAESQELHWLSHSVDEGLQSCLDIATLTPMISEGIIGKVVISLAVVNEWFSICQLLSKMGTHLRIFGSRVPFNASFRTEVMLGKQFKDFYNKMKQVEVPEDLSRKVTVAVRPFELRVQNFLNLAAVEHYHATNGLEFPHRQGGRAIPHIQTGSGAVSTYTRYYSKGVVKQFSETCRICHLDGHEDKVVHYGCWEEMAQSFERCVTIGGIYYNASLPISNVYSCVQSPSWRSPLWRSCGDRPRQ